MAGALEGQRRLVREVHHRVKNNLQVVASLLNIHGRSAEAAEARAAYDSISRRVGALSIVHRNHFAEMEENRGIALRPLLSELAAELRAGAPEPARGLLHRARSRHHLHDAGRRRRRRLPGHRDRRVRDARPAPGSDRDVASPDERAHRAPDPGQPDPRSRRSRRARKSPVRTDRRGVWPSSCAPRSIASWGGTALICLYFRQSNSDQADRYGGAKKILPRLGTDFEQGAFCTSDSDLLPPRSRYPIKWARNRQPSPPPVALPGPLLSGAPLPSRADRAARRAARQCVSRMARMANSYRP